MDQILLGRQPHVQKRLLLWREVAGGDGFFREKSRPVKVKRLTKIQEEDGVPFVRALNIVLSSVRGEEETEHVALVPQWFGLQQDTEEEDMYERKGSAFSVDDRQEYTPYSHRNKWYD